MKEGFAGLRGVALVVCASLVAGCVAPAISATSGLNGIEHILVIYAENRSFDHLYGLFPGANGIANASPRLYLQVDRDGRELATLPAVWRGENPDPAFPGRSMGPADRWPPCRRYGGGRTPTRPFRPVPRTSRFASTRRRSICRSRRPRATPSTASTRTWSRSTGEGTNASSQHRTRAGS